MTQKPTILKKFTISLHVDMLVFFLLPSVKEEIKIYF